MQLQVLEFISDFREEHGFPPTYREIMQNFAWTSTNSVHTHLEALERKGMLTSRAMETRTLVPTAAGFAALGVSPTINNNLPCVPRAPLSIAFAEETPTGS